MSWLNWDWSQTKREAKRKKKEEQASKAIKAVDGKVHSYTYEPAPAIGGYRAIADVSWTDSTSGSRLREYLEYDRNTGTRWRNPDDNIYSQGMLSVWDAQLKVLRKYMRNQVLHEKPARPSLHEVIASRGYPVVEYVDSDTGPQAYRFSKAARVLS